MPSQAGPIRRKAASPLVEEQRTQDGYTPRLIGMARRNPAGRNRAAGIRPAVRATPLRSGTVSAARKPSVM
jgi:hypothetical protein